MMIGIEVAMNEKGKRKKQKSMLKGLRHGFVGLGTLWAVTQLIVVPLNERKTSCC